MKDFMSKQQYCYKIQTLLMKSVLTQLCRRPPQYGLPPLPFLQEKLEPPSMISQKSQPPINKGVYFMDDYGDWQLLVTKIISHRSFI